MVSFSLSIGRGAKVKLLYIFSLIVSIYRLKRVKAYLIQQIEREICNYLQVNEGNNSEINLKVNNNIIIENFNTVECTYNLHNIKYIFDDGEYILIEVSENRYILIPNRAFNNSDIRNEFIDLIKENLNIDLTKNIDEKLIQIMESNY